MFQWLREYLDIRAEFRERRTRLTIEKEEEVCQSCETLKELLIQSNNEKMVILNKLVNPTIPSVPIVENGPPMIPLPRTLPWNVRRQMLEKEDRHKAQLLKETPKPITSDAEMKEFENELKDAEQRRQKEGS